LNEVEWVQLVARQLGNQPWLSEERLSVQTGLKLAYGSEIVSYGPEQETHMISFATDLALTEELPNERWRPRVVVEAKLGSITTHDAITYSQKAAVHRSVHPYLRYGVMLGDREHYPLPGRLYRHGAQFDFMISFCAETPTDVEMATFVEVLQAEVTASRILEKIMYESRKRGRDRYTLLHRRLRVK
jgi:hypothetical protein